MSKESLKRAIKFLGLRMIRKPLTKHCFAVFKKTSLDLELTKILILHASSHRKAPEKYSKTNPCKE